MNKYSVFYYFGRLAYLVIGCVAVILLALPAALAYPVQVVQHRIAVGGEESLLTPVARYTHPSGVTVDLVGAVHLAESGYYRNLNRAFKRYDKVLYEMVDGEGISEMLRIARKIEQKTATAEEQQTFERMVEEQNKGGDSAFNNMLSSYYVLMAQSLKLSLQTECIDYSLDNMVFADVSSEELAEAMKNRGESWFGLIVGSMFQGGSSGGMSSLVSTRKELRRSFIRGLAKECSRGSNAMENSAIIITRNERCLAVLDRELIPLAAGSRVAIFYGAMHLRDMHYRMLERGFSLHGVQWLTAIRG